MDVPLHPEDLRFIQEEVRAGRFRSPEDVLSHALNLLRGQQFTPEHQRYLRDEIRKVSSNSIEVTVRRGTATASANRLKTGSKKGRNTRWPE